MTIDEGNHYLQYSWNILAVHKRARFRRQILSVGLWRVWYACSEPGKTFGYSLHECQHAGPFRAIRY